MLAVIESWENEHSNAEENFGNVDVKVNFRHHQVWKRTINDNEFEKKNMALSLYIFIEKESKMYKCINNMSTFAEVC